MAANKYSDKIRRAVAAACAPLGVKAHDITVSARGISIPAEGVTVALELSAGGKVWRGMSTYSVFSALGDNEKQVTTVLFEEPFDHEWQVAKRIAMQIAESRIDYAIDEATA